jgi:hypothetical protein
MFLNANEMMGRRVWTQCIVLTILFLSFVHIAHGEMHNPMEAINMERQAVAMNAAITLTVTPGIFVKSGDEFEVRWSGVPSPSFNDWIALLVPAGADTQKTAPVKYKMAVASGTHATTGSGKLK